FIDMFSGLKEPPNCLYASVSNEQNQYSSVIKQMVEETMKLWRSALETLIDKVLESHTTKMEINKTALADHFNVVIECTFILSKALNDPKMTAIQLVHYKQYLDLIFEDKR